MERIYKIAPHLKPKEGFPDWNGWQKIIIKPADVKGAYRINNQFWGMGYGKEAALAIKDIAFRDLKLHRIEAGIEPTNRRSIMLARSIGLRKEGLKNGLFIFAILGLISRCIAQPAKSLA